jgi:hypothetical protein
MHTPYAAFRGKNGLPKPLALGATVSLVSLLHFSYYFNDFEVLPALLRFTSENQPRRNDIVFLSVGRFQPPVRALSSILCEPSVADRFRHNGLSLPTRTQYAPLTNFSGTLPRPLLHELRFMTQLRTASFNQSIQASTPELLDALSSDSNGFRQTRVSHPLYVLHLTLH